MSSELRARPIRLRWDAEKGRLVEVEDAQEEGTRKLGATARHGADLEERERLLEHSTELLDDVALRALGRERLAEMAGATMSLPVAHAITDKSVAALGEVWRVLGSDRRTKDIIIAPGQGFLARLKALDDPLERGVIRQEGLFREPHDGRPRQDKPLEDTGETLFVVSPTDIAAAREAQARLMSIPPTAAEVAESERIMREWEAQAAAEKVILDAQLHDWANGDHKPKGSKD